jgi:hypothetical protein
MKATAHYLEAIDNIRGSLVAYPVPDIKLQKISVVGECSLLRFSSGSHGRVSGLKNVSHGILLLPHYSSDLTLVRD